MVQFNDLKTKGLYKSRVYLANAIPEEDTEQKEALDGLYLEFREMSKKQSFRIQQAGEAAQDEATAVMWECLVDHNVMQDGEKVADKEVIAFVEQSSNIFAYTIETWMGDNPLARRSAGSSNGQDAQ
jgi:hypothetical protein